MSKPEISKPETEIIEFNKQIVFRLDSDSKSIVFIPKYPKDKLVIYASEGRYGGYILKLSDLFPDQNISNVTEDVIKDILSDYRAFFVEPKVVVAPDNVKKEIMDLLLHQPEDLWREFIRAPPQLPPEFIGYVDVEEVMYSLTEINYEIKKISETYVVLDLKPKQNPQRLTAKAIRIIRLYRGSRRHPQGHLARRISDELKFKHPENELIQKYLYHKPGGDYRDSLLILKIPVDVPNFFEIEKEEVEEEEPTTTAVEPEEEETKPKVIEPIELRSKELELEPVTPLPTVKEEKEESVEEKPRTKELVKIYLLSMRLPSKYLMQKVYYEKNKEIREFNDVSSKLETIRREAYSMVSRVFAYVEEFGTWIGVSEDAVREAMKVSEYVIQRLKEINLHDKVSRYVVKAIPVYLEPENAKELLDAAVKHLSEDVDELEKRISEAEEEKKKQALKRLEREKEYKEKLLEAFRKFLSEIK